MARRGWLSSRIPRDRAHYRAGANHYRTIMKTERIRSTYKARARIVITAKTRSANGFAVVGPDKKSYWAKSKKEAIANLQARIACYELDAWKVVAL